MIGRLLILVMLACVAGGFGCGFQPYLTDTLGLLPGPTTSLLERSVYGTPSTTIGTTGITGTTGTTSSTGSTVDLSGLVGGTTSSTDPNST